MPAVEVGDVIDTTAFPLLVVAAATVVATVAGAWAVTAAENSVVVTVDLVGSTVGVVKGEWV